MTRTDIHRPSAPEFDPEAYELRGVFDLHPDYPAPAMTQARLAIVNALIDQGYRFGSHGSGQCGHCGANIRYAALMIRADAHEMIYVGETCLDNRFSRTKREFDALRKQAQLDRARHAKLAAFTALCEQSPALTYATYSENVQIGLEREARALWGGSHGEDDVLAAGLGWGFGTLHDIARKARTYGDASDRQLALVDRILSEQEGRWATYVARENAKTELVASGVQAPEGRVTVTGQIVSLKEREGYMGDTEWKITVKTDEGWLAWATAPGLLWDAWRDAKASMDLEPWLRTQRLTFTVTLTRSDDDPLFAFAKRPAKASLAAA